MSRIRDIEPWDQLLERGRNDELVVDQSSEFARPADRSPIPETLHPTVVEALKMRGINELWSHQAAAFDAFHEGSVIVTTGTASGKSLCFSLPTLDTLNRDSRARALYIYPTKALAQDQARALNELKLKQARLAIYDGDTPKEQRKQIRTNANILLTNPDMLHVGILPNHAAWGNFFANLAIVVIDEAHVYRGVFGSHFANVIRRLRRIADAYGTHPRFLLASATIANSLELAEDLTGVEGFKLISENGAPRSKRTIAMWNPPLLDEQTGARRSAISEAAELLVKLTQQGARTIVFMKSRKGIELLAKFARLQLEQEGNANLAERIAPYRSGYTSQQRRELERKLVDGELLGVIATDALELGIDIGKLDAAICVTFPGTVASLRQMWGRAGRRGNGLALYVAGDDALDQFFCRHPNEFLDRPVETAIINYEHDQIYASHLLCAAHEGPLEPADAEFLGPRWLAHAEALETAGKLRRTTPRNAVSSSSSTIFVARRADTYPAAELSLRSTGYNPYAIVDVDSGEIIGTLDGARVFSTAHSGAIYIHGGISYEVLELDTHNHHALIRQFHEGWYTQPKRETDVTIEQVLKQRDVNGIRLSLANVDVSDQVVGYRRRQLKDSAVIDYTPLDLPVSSFPTQAIYYELAGGFFPEDQKLNEMLGALHAAEHSQIAVLPLLAMCDRWDIGGLSTNHHPETGVPTVFIYDGHPGGIGIVRHAFEEFEQLVSDAHLLIDECPCASGCPSCIQSPKCGNLNEPLSKKGAIDLMAKILQQS